MKKQLKRKSKGKHIEAQIGKALRTGGFLFPKTIDEVKEFERIYGTTDVILPIELQEPDFLYTKSPKSIKGYKEFHQPENIAMAAREGVQELPPEIQKKMAEDRKLFDSKRKRKKKK